MWFLLLSYAFTNTFNKKTTQLSHADIYVLTGKNKMLIFVRSVVYIQTTASSSDTNTLGWTIYGIATLWEQKKKCCTNQPLKNLPYRPSKCQADKWQSDGSDGRANGRGHRWRCRTWIRVLILRTGTDDSVFIESVHQRWSKQAQIRPGSVKWWQLLGVGPITTH